MRREDEHGFIKMESGPCFAAGEKVRLVGNLFSLCSAFFEGMLDKDRVAILLNLMGRKVRMVVNQAILEQGNFTPPNQYPAPAPGTPALLNVRDVLRFATINGAKHLRLDSKTGSLRVGKEADIAVWDHDMYSVPTGELKNLKCEMTLFHGEIVYKAATTPITVKNPGREGIATH